MQKKEVEKYVILCNNGRMEVQHEILHLQRQPMGKTGGFGAGGSQLSGNASDRGADF
jgi:hypothetical protein